MPEAWNGLLSISYRLNLPSLIHLTINTVEMLIKIRDTIFAVENLKRIFIKITIKTSFNFLTMKRLTV